MRAFAKPFYQTQAWKHCREAYAQSVGGLCERCLQSGLYVPGTVVHHIVPLSPDNIGDTNITLNWNNLKLLCRDCHAAEHKTPDRYRFGADGSIHPC